jgi:hypothetical protein
MVRQARHERLIRKKLFAITLLMIAATAVSAEPRTASYQAWGGVSDAWAISDSSPTTAALADSGPASLFLMLENEAVLAGLTLKTSGAAPSVTVSVSQDAVSWTPAAVRVESDGRRDGPGPDGSGRRGDGHVAVTRLTFVAPTMARALMVKIAFAGRRLAIHDVALEVAPTAVIKVSEISIEEIEENAATIRWRTDLPAKTELLYGFRPTSMHSGGDPAYEFSMDHVVRLTGLLPGTDYQAWILIGRDSAVGAAPNRPLTFRTAGAPLPYATGFRHELGRDTAVIRFVGNVPARAVMEWREQGSGAAAVCTAPATGGDAYVTENSVVLTGLAPRVTYEYQVMTTDTRGRSTATPWISFATSPFNIAAGRPATGTFTELSDEQAAGDTRPALDRITDGRNDYFRGMATSGNPRDTDQWVEVDLGAPSLVNTIEMVWRGNAYPRDYYVMTSADGAHWAYPGFGLDAGAGAPERSTGGDPLRRVSLAVDVTAPVRFIKVFVPRGSDYVVKTPSWRFVQLAEVEAHGIWESAREGDSRTAMIRAGDGR